MSTRVNLLSKLRNQEYRHAFLSSAVNELIATQIRLMRKRRRWDQIELGRRAGMKQAAISRLENPDYGSVSVSTLKRLAKALDVGLVVRFVGFGEVAEWQLNLSPAKLTPPSYAEDVRLRSSERDAWTEIVGGASKTTKDRVLSPDFSRAATGQMEMDFDKVEGSGSLSTESTAYRVSFAS